MNKKLAIVVIAFNRIDCLKRMYEQLIKCEYTTNVDLIISIDNSGKDTVENYARTLSWEHGNLIIKTFEKNLGLRKHVLTCGSYSKDYDAIIVLEDDVLPSKYFMNYCKEAVDFYYDDEQIGGISLYQHLWNTNANYAFIPDLDPNYDNYFMQFAQSWGQVWTNKQWESFYKWYEQNSDNFSECDNVPDSVCKYPNSSWLKYYTRYIIETNKYFVYPNYPMSTNFSDAGTHNTSSATHYQVPMLNVKKLKYNFCKLEDSKVIYDAYHERMNLGKYLEVDDKDLTVDFYGIKSIHATKYLLSIDKLDYKIVKTYGLQMKPFESNIINNIKGNDIKLYDLTIKESNTNKEVKTIKKRLFYSNRDIKLPQLYKMTYFITIDKMKLVCRLMMKKLKGKRK